jgi:hypothetical protein
MKLTPEEVAAIAREVKKQLEKEQKEKEEQDKEIEEKRRKKDLDDWKEYFRKEREREDNMSCGEHISDFCFSILCKEYGPAWSIPLLIFLLAMLTKMFSETNLMLAILNR